MKKMIIQEGRVKHITSYNRFESFSTEMKCYKCNTFGHMAKDCRITVPPRESQQNNNNHRQEP
jgi:hypothetical protein